ncbi:kinase-like protein [Dendrothele bispora CBS 962.96]|uniref:Kinase-like protein n=1 Tax=Dendrothele bispora (strain CBS 962.96) TaxID=1314807 RepID=A0A4S8MAN1_DENBC|nr:kinase-like protein [Dendrothele bispora CBS 962.96]
MPEDILSAYASTLIDLTDSVRLDDTRPHAFGGFADIWLGWYTCSTGKTEKVAIKRLRIRNQEGETNRLARYLGKELRVWKRLNHPNILPLYGLTSELGSLPAMVCPWQEHGNLTRHLALVGHEMSSKDRYDMLMQVVKGLQYLHTSSVIQGDLTGSNILIGRDKQIYLSDFGLSTIKRDPSSSSHGTSSHGTSTLSVPGGAGAVRWAAPEIFLPDDHGQLASVSFAGDVYSFGSVWLQILTGHIPYHHLKNEVAVIIQLSRGERPPRPPIEYLTDNVWSFIQKCWSNEPHLRPNTHDVTVEVGKHVTVSPSINSDVSTLPTGELDNPADQSTTSQTHPITAPPTHSSESIINSRQPEKRIKSLRHKLQKFNQSLRSATRLSRHLGRVSQITPTVLEQIGIPDYQGYIERRRGQHGSLAEHWRTCYLILKGVHLYRLGSSGPTQDPNLKGYTKLVGYQVTVESSDALRPTEFQLFKEGDPAQYFRSTDTRSIQTWIQAFRTAISLNTDSEVSAVSISSIGSVVSRPSSEEEL